VPRGKKGEERKVGTNGYGYDGVDRPPIGKPFRMAGYKGVQMARGEGAIIFTKGKGGGGRDSGRGGMEKH